MDFNHLFSNCKTHVHNPCDFICSRCQTKLCYECIGQHVDLEKGQEYKIISIQNENKKVKEIVKKSQKIKNSLTQEGVKGLLGDLLKDALNETPIVEKLIDRFIKREKKRIDSMMSQIPIDS